MDWLKSALKYVYDREGVRGLAVATGLLIALLAAITALLTLTPLGGWVAEWVGV